MFVLGVLHIRTGTGRLRVILFICLKETRNSCDDKGSSVPPYPKEFVVLVFVKSAVLSSRGIKPPLSVYLFGQRSTCDEKMKW